MKGIVVKMPDVPGFSFSGNRIIDGPLAPDTQPRRPLTISPLDADQQFSVRVNRNTHRVIFLDETEDWVTVAIKPKNQA